MTLAIVHDYISQCGGGERLVMELCRMFPDAVVYTSFYDADGTFPEFRDIPIVASPLQRFIDPAHFRRYAPLFPLIFAHLDLKKHEKIIISSSAFAHHVRHPNAYVYCHTPPRFLYSANLYSDKSNAARWAAPLLATARTIDRRSAKSKKSYAANSATTAKRIWDSYARRADIIYPPLWTDHLPAEPPPLPARPAVLMVARLLGYKRVDVAIKACERAGLPLTVVGDGPLRLQLEALAGPSTRFCGKVSDSQMAGLFSSHSVVLAPGIEDFGFGPVEAHWSGRPVVSINQGGGAETVVDGVNGRLLPDWDVGRWATAISEVVAQSWSPMALRESAEKFSAAHFEERTHQWLATA